METVQIFYRETDREEQWLNVNEQGITYYTENSGWALLRNGPQKRDQKMSLEQAMTRWPRYAEEIEQAYARLVGA